MFDQQTVEMLLVGVWDTLYMTVVATFFSYVFGMVMGVVLVICRKDGIRPNALVYNVLDVVVNLTRSFPFLILMIAVIPFTRFLVGTTIGNNATVVPLVLAAAPFVARLVESSLLEVDNGVVEAAQSMGPVPGRSSSKCCCPRRGPRCSTAAPYPPSPFSATRPCPGPWAAADWASSPSCTATTAIRPTSWSLRWFC